jgi:hypothetical protein
VDLRPLHALSALSALRLVNLHWSQDGGGGGPAAVNAAVSGLVAALPLLVELDVAEFADCVALSLTPDAAARLEVLRAYAVRPAASDGGALLSQPGLRMPRLRVMDVNSFHSFSPDDGPSDDWPWHTPSLTTLSFAELAAGGHPAEAWLRAQTRLVDLKARARAGRRDAQGAAAARRPRTPLLTRCRRRRPLSPPLFAGRRV